MSIVWRNLRLRLKLGREMDIETGIRNQVVGASQVRDSVTVIRAEDAKPLDPYSKKQREQTIHAGCTISLFEEYIMSM
jgi:hypothetical protein